MAFTFGAFLLLIENLINKVNNESSTFDIQLQDTLFVIAHVHLISFFVLIFLAFAAVYLVFPNTYFICRPYHYAGLEGMPRRYMDYSTWVSLDGYSVLNKFTSQVIILLVCGQVVFVANLVWSLVKGRRSSNHG